MEWDDFRYFLALARLGSVRAAGQALGVSHSTVARRVEALEAVLSTRLFDRSRDGYQLAEAGRTMLPVAERIEAEMTGLERELLGRDVRLAGPVSLTCSDRYISEILLAELTPFCAQFPEIELALTIDGRPLNLSRREADIAVRLLQLGTQPPEHLIGARLAPLMVATYVASAHAHRLDPERGGQAPRWVAGTDRKGHDALVAATSYPDVPSWGAFSTLDLLVQAAIHGHGFVLLPAYVGDREPALQRLVRPDLRHLADVWMLCHPDLRDNARLRATRAVVVTAIQRQLGWFEGRSADAPVGPEIGPRDPLPRPLR